MQFETVKEDQILAAFPDQMLTPEVCQQVLKCLESITESHHHLADAMYSVKQLMPTIPVGAFWLILQGLLQPMIKLKG